MLSNMKKSYGTSILNIFHIDVKRTMKQIDNSYCLPENGTFSTCAVRELYPLFDKVPEIKIYLVV